ncbi:MAG: GDSL-type esterase/lipase family protein [Pseudomonadota bacterium]
MKRLSVALLALAMFAWGLATGFYHVFPYEPIRALKNRAEGDDPNAPRPVWTNPDAFTVADADLILDTPADVVMLGDSVTAGGRWHEMFPDVRIVNRGVGGDTVTGVLRRAPRIAAMRPKAVFVMIGINDVVSGNSAQVVLDRYAAAIRILRRSGAQVYVQSVLACGARCDDEQRARVAAIDAALPALAARYGAAWIDLNTRLGDGKTLRPGMSWDGIHLTGAGYAAWRDALRPAVAKYARSGPS